MENIEACKLYKLVIGDQIPILKNDDIESICHFVIAYDYIHYALPFYENFISPVLENYTTDALTMIDAFLIHNSSSPTPKYGLNAFDIVECGDYFYFIIAIDDMRSNFVYKKIDMEIIVEYNRSIKKENKKRTDYISWEEYFMGIAELSAMRSKDPNTQVGACIVSEDNRIISIGYNGLPRGCSDDDFPWCRGDDDSDPYDTKYSYTCHAELNAILNTQSSLKDTILYVTLFPCNECAKAIIQSGIKELVYKENQYASGSKLSSTTRAAKRMFDAAGITYRVYNKE